MLDFLLLFFFRVCHLVSSLRFMVQVFAAACCCCCCYSFLSFVRSLARSFWGHLLSLTVLYRIIVKRVVSVCFFVCFCIGVMFVNFYFASSSSSSSSSSSCSVRALVSLSLNRKTDTPKGEGANS